MEQFNLFDLFGDFNQTTEATVPEVATKDTTAKTEAVDTPKAPATEEKKEVPSNITPFNGAFEGFDDIESEEDGNDDVSSSDDDEKKKDAPAATPKKKGAKSYEGPIKVVGNGWGITIGESGKKMTGDAIVKAIYEAGYKEVLTASMSITKKAPFTLYVNTINGTLEDDDTNLPEVTICLGNMRVSYTKDSFEGLCEEEISVFDVALKFAEQYPEFKGCGLTINVGAKMATPSFKGADFKVKKGETYTVWSENGTSQMSGDDILVTGAKAVKSNSDVLFLYYVPPKESDRITCPKIVEDGTKSKIKEIYHLPLTIWLETYGNTYHVSSEDFGGKESVEKGDIMDYLKGIHKIFNSSNRAFSFVYDRENSKVGVAVISGKKGAAVAAPSAKIIDFPLWKITQLKDRIERTAIGIFSGKEDERTRLVTGVDFKMTLPKIPSFFLTAIIAEFKKDLTKECMIQIYYSVKDKGFYMVKPEAEYDKVSVRYKMTHTNDFLVVSIHSHNTMKAIFSRTDNEDEIYTGLFGVIGDLDKPVISMSFRAGMEGAFKELSYSDIFDMGGTVA